MNRNTRLTSTAYYGYPLKIVYMQIGNITFKCQWNSVNAQWMQDIQSPSLIDFLALERTLPRAEMAGTGLGKKVKNARARAERRIAKAVSYLEDLEISESEIKIFVKTRIQTRLNTDVHVNLYS